MRLEVFKALVSSTVDNRNPDTGDLSVYQSNELRGHFKGLTEEDREEAREWVKKEMKDSILALNITRARAFLVVEDGLGKKRARTPSA